MATGADTAAEPVGTAGAGHKDDGAVVPLTRLASERARASHQTFQADVLIHPTEDGGADIEFRGMRAPLSRCDGTLAAFVHGDTLLAVCINRADGTVHYDVFDLLDSAGGTLARVSRGSVGPDDPEGLLGPAGAGTTALLIAHRLIDALLYG